MVRGRELVTLQQSKQEERGVLPAEQQAVFQCRPGSDAMLIGAVSSVEMGAPFGAFESKNVLRLVHFCWRRVGSQHCSPQSEAYCSIKTQLLEYMACCRVHEHKKCSQ